MSTEISNQTLQNLEREINDSDQLMYMRSDELEVLKDALRSLSMKTGWAIYMHENGKGLTSLKTTEAPLPNTQKLNEAMKHSKSSKHFALYVFPVIEQSQWLESKPAPHEIAEFNTKNSRYLFVLHSTIRTDFFDKYGKKVDFEVGVKGKLMLRDGEWVTSNDLL